VVIVSSVRQSVQQPSASTYVLSSELLFWFLLFLPVASVVTPRTPIPTGTLTAEAGFPIPPAVD